MAHVVTDACVRCKYTDCVATCPVECFYELENMLIIHPDECIDCGACVPECPVEAIFMDYEVPEQFEKYIEFNAVKSKEMEEDGIEPIIDTKSAHPDADKYKDGCWF